MASFVSRAPGKDTKNYLNHKALWFVIADLPPFSAIEGDGMLDLLNALHPLYVPPSRKTLRVMLETEYLQVKEQIMFVTKPIIVTWPTDETNFRNQYLLCSHM